MLQNLNFRAFYFRRDSGVRNLRISNLYGPTGVRRWEVFHKHLEARNGILSIFLLKP